MRLLVPLALVIVLSLIISKSNAVVWRSEDKIQMLEDAGCTKFGKLLEKGACTVYGYNPHVIPERGQTKVLTTIRFHKVDAVNARDGTLSVLSLIHI